MDPIAGLKQTIARLGYAKIGIMVSVAVAVMVLLYWVSTVSVEPKALLYSGLDVAEAAKIGQRLDELKVPFDVKGDGTTIMVPASQVARARMELAASGLPRQGGAGYELLDQQSPMNMTSFMQRIQRLRALEGELARTIVTLNSVRTARVHIVLPERETFARDTPKPTASVAVTMTGAGRLSLPQASAIRLLVSGAVPGMAPESVSVMDPSGIVIAADDSEAAASNRMSELKASREHELRSAVTELLEPLIGRGKVRVAASIELDASREVSHEEKFDPLSQVERSKQLQVDQDATNETKAQEAVSVSQNLPNQSTGTGGESGKSTSSNSRNGQTVNYEISSIRNERVREAGDLKRMTVAVVVDGSIDDKGQYQPRSQEEMTRLSDLIQSAVGFDVNRGDRVTVENMHFLAEAPSGTEANSDAPPSQTLPSVGLAVGGGVLIVLIAGLAMMAMRKRAPAQLADAEDQARDPAALAALPNAAAVAPTLTLARAAPQLSIVPAEQRLTITHTQEPGQPIGLPAAVEASDTSEPKQQVIKRYQPPEPEQQALLAELFELIDARPDEALATLRSWLAGE